MTVPVPDTSRQSTTSTPLLILGLVVAIVIAVVGHLLHNSFFHDDAYITLRYSQNWLEGDGIVWNPGDRVEGYTSFLHLATVSLLGALRLDLVTATKVIGLGSYVGICLFSLFCFRSTTQSFFSLRQVLLFLLVPASFPLIAWSYGGLETSLVTLLVMVSSYTFVASMDHSRKRLVILGLLFALACLARPDVLLLVVITVLFLLCPRRSKPVGWAAAGIFLAGFAILYLPYFGWRYWYYEELLPNTFYAKMTGINLFRLRTGGNYLHTFARLSPFLLPAALVSSVVIVRLGKWSWKHAYMLAFILGHSLYIIYTGGDHMPAYRFFVPLIPAMGWLVATGGSELVNSGRCSSWVLALLAVVLVLGQGVTKNERMLNAQRLDPAAAEGADVGHWLKENFPAGSLIALNTAGSTPYYAKQLLFIDMLGLNNKQIAHRRDVPMRTWWQRVTGHAKGDGKYVLQQQPDVIILGPALGLRADPDFVDQENVVWFLSDQELAESGDFKAQYRQQRVTFKGHSGAQRTLIYYERRADSEP
ncbi:MAG TPA: hypothetical protein EYN70_09640 [Planctomycetaceae bacterium]|nr:hypothetical protein [Planctomycetaceae bacterium]